MHISAYSVLQNIVPQKNLTSPCKSTFVFKAIVNEYKKDLNDWRQKPKCNNIIHTYNIYNNSD